MVSRVAGLFTVLLLLLARSSAAQEPLTLDRAVSAALAGNAALRATRAGEREAAARVEEARAGYLPRVDYVESWQRGNDPVYVFSSLLNQQRFAAANFELGALNHPDPLTNHQGMLVVEQPVFDAARLAGIRTAGLASRVAGETTAEERADLAVRVTRAFGGVLQAAARRRAADAAVEAAQEDLARAERRRDAGLATEADVLSLKVFLAQVQEARIRAASGEQVARAQLNRLMGAPLDAVYALAEPPPPSGAGSPEGDDEAAALRSRPMVRRAEAQLALAATSHAAARAAFLPQLHVQGLYETNGNAFGHRAHEWLASGQLRLNLFAGGGDAARLRAAAAAEARAKAERDDALDAARLEVRTARAEYDAAVAREAVGRAAVLQARESQRIIRDRYEAGLVGVTDLLRAASALLDAETLRIASVVDVFVCRAALDRATGRLR